MNGLEGRRKDGERERNQAVCFMLHYIITH